MNNFIFENKTKVYFGKGGVKEYLGCLLGNYGETVMLAYGGGSIKRNGVYDEIMDILNAAGKRVMEFDRIMPNPTYAKAQEGAKLARENHVDLILAVGGGSVSDCCKVISAQAKLDEDIWELENTKHTFPTEFIPLGTIVTVFGTGSEMNNGAVITHEEKKIKGALWGAQADFAFLDPSYTLSVPMKQIISGAFDTLSHAMETYFGKPDENNLSDDISEAVMRSVIDAQLKAVIDRTVARWLEVKNKEFYYIVTMADEAHSSADTTLACFRGYADCVESAVEKGVIIGSGVYEPGKVKNTLAMKQAYEMGKNV